MQGRVGAWETDFCPDNGSGTKIALGQRGVPPEIQAGDLFVIGDTQNSPLVGGLHKTGLDQRELRVGGRQTPEELSVNKKRNASAVGAVKAAGRRGLVTCWERFSDPVVVWEANRAGRGLK